MAACAKHFPGHGDTATDSHLTLPRLDHDLERLRAVELPPFAASVEAGVASVMTAHVLFPALDRDHPATLSPEIMSLLREELGYEGVIFSDDLEMKAVADHFEPATLVDRGLAAGVDAFLVCRDAALREEVLELLEAMPASRTSLPLARVDALRESYGGPREGAPATPYASHQELARMLSS